MENQNHENKQERNFQKESEWLEKLKELVENAPNGANFLVIASANIEESTKSAVISAGGQPHGVMSQIALAMHKSNEIEGMIRTAITAKSMVPSTFFEMFTR